jgi:hypothetical protein
MAERDQYFNATDVMLKNAPMHRFIRAGREDDRWFVWFERGGIAYNRNIVVLAWKPGEASPRLIAHTLYFGENPCRLTDGILDGHLPAQSSGRW